MTDPRPPSARIADPDPEVRYRALVELGAAADLPLLLGRLSDESWRVRKAAVDRLTRALGEEDVPRIIDALVEKLGSADDAGARNSAAEALVRIGPRAAPALVARLSGDDADVRKFACDVLGEMGDASTAPAVAQALSDADRNVRAAAAEALGKIGGPRAVEALEQVLATDDSMLKLVALDGLGRAAWAPPLGVLAPLARHKDFRRSALRLLGLREEPAAVELLVDALSDAKKGVRETAFASLARYAGAWGERGRTTLVKVLSPALKSTTRPDEAARRMLGSDDALAVQGAMLVLGLVRHAPDAILLARAGEDERQRDAAVVAISSIGAAAGPVLLDALEGLTPPSRAVAVRALARLREPGATQPLIALAQDGGDEERAAAIEALGVLGDLSAVEPLFALLEDDAAAAQAAAALAALGRADGSRIRALAKARLDSGTAPWAIRLLGAVGVAEDLATLKVAMKSERAELRVAVTDAALSLGAPEAEKMLRNALADEAAAVRAGAARALGGFNTDKSRKSLVAALGDREVAVVAAAAESLGHVGNEKAKKALEGVVASGLALADGAGLFAAVAGLKALARLGMAAPAMLAAAARHRDGEVAKEAVEAASALADGLAVLLDAARHERWDVRRAAAKALGKSGDARALGELEKLAAAERDPLAAEAMVQALSALRARQARRG